MTETFHVWRSTPRSSAISTTSASRRSARRSTPHLRDLPRVRGGGRGARRRRAASWRRGHRPRRSSDSGSSSDAPSDPLRRRRVGALSPSPAWSQARPRWWRRPMPAWAQAAAAALIFAVGPVARRVWRGTSTSGAVSRRDGRRRVAAHGSARRSSASDLAALEQRLRSEMTRGAHASHASRSAPATRRPTRRSSRGCARSSTRASSGSSASWRCAPRRSSAISTRSGASISRGSSGRSARWKARRAPRSRSSGRC